MELQIERVKVKDKIIACRFSREVFTQIEKLAKENKTTMGNVIRALVDKSLSPTPTLGENKI